MNKQDPGLEERLRRLAGTLRELTPDPVVAKAQGRGIVVAAGGASLFTNAYVLLHVLRHTLGCPLPIELWYFGPEELSPAMAATVSDLDVMLVDATPVIAATGANIRDGWQLKAFALAYSRFAEVLLLDADQVPVRDPTALFEWPQYHAHGAVFWPDIVDLRRDNRVWQLLGLESRRAISFESGQMLVDRRRHAVAIRAALLLNEHSDDLYRLIYGDKDTYLLSWELLRSPFSLVPHRPYVDQFALVQRDFDGAPLFQHRTNAKWQYGGEQVAIAGFVHEQACFAALETLRKSWGGRVFRAPDRTARARQAELELVAQGEYLLEAADDNVTRLELRPHAEIGAGRAADRQNWWVQENDGQLQLVLTGGGLNGYLIDDAGDGSWVGQRLRRPVVGVSLLPQGELQVGDAALHPGLVDELLRASGAATGDGEALRRFGIAFDLLAKVLPGAPERLTRLADGDEDAELAATLRDIAHASATTPRTRHAFDLQTSLQQGYVRDGTKE